MPSPCFVFVTKPHWATCFCGKLNDTSAEQQALTAKAYGTMNTPGLPWSKTLSIYEARDNHCWNMPTQMRLNSLVAQQTRVCYLSVSLSVAGKSFAGGSLLTYWKPPAIEISMLSEQQEQWTLCRGWAARWTNLPLLHRNSLLSCSLELGKLKQPLPIPPQP